MLAVFLSFIGVLALVLMSAAVQTTRNPTLAPTRNPTIRQSARPTRAAFPIPVILQPTATESPTASQRPTAARTHRPTPKTDRPIPDPTMKPTNPTATPTVQPTESRKNKPGDLAADTVLVKVFGKLLVDAPGDSMDYFDSVDYRGLPTAVLGLTIGQCHSISDVDGKPTASTVKSVKYTIINDSDDDDEAKLLFSLYMTANCDGQSRSTEVYSPQILPLIGTDGDNPLQFWSHLGDAAEVSLFNSSDYWRARDDDDEPWSEPPININALKFNLNLDCDSDSGNQDKSFANNNYCLEFIKKQNDD